MLHAPGHSFSDVAARWSRSSTSPRSPRSRRRSAQPVHPLRFRGNIYVEGWPAWHEFDLVGQEIAIGAARGSKIVKRIVRCAATNVDPDTGMRDLAIPRALMQSFGHADCGVYGEVVQAGEIAVGERRDRATATRQEIVMTGRRLVDAS